MKILYFSLFSLLLLFSIVSPAFGQMMHKDIGVQEGDTFSYSYTCYFDSDDSSFTEPPDFSWINQTDYYMMNITGISGSMVHYDTDMHMLNGTNFAGTGYMNIEEGHHSMSGYNPMGSNSYYFMGPNVGMMGRMYPSASNSPTINDTLTWNYPDGERTINHMSIIIDENGVMNHTDYYFDQATGAMVEWRQQYIQTNGDLQANSTQIMQLTGSSVWTIPEFSTPIIMSLICTMTVFAIILKQRNKQPLKEH